jgi:hypothetical protein
VGLPPDALFDAGTNVCRAVEAVREDLEPGDVVQIKGRTVPKLERAAVRCRRRPGGRPGIAAEGEVGSFPQMPLF